MCIDICYHSLTDGWLNVFLPDGSRGLHLILDVAKAQTV